MGAHVERLDGNALAGVLAELLSVDASTLRITCRHCGSRGDMAEVAVERDDVGSIVRCLGCGHTLFVVLRERGGIRLRFEGAAEIATG
jgi:DNA-directed RNA polymerase subunit RPC12/RpoP